MNTKEITYSDDARQKLASGVQKLTDVVKVTMGPKGRNVLIEKSYGSPVLTKDGVSVALEVQLPDKVENLGAQLVKEVASNTAEEAGDGTTTATVLANAIFSEGLRNITSGANPIEVKKGMEKATEEILKNLKNSSKSVTTKLEHAQVATISANGDTDIGDMIAEAMEQVGQDGVITVEEAKGIKDELTVVEGLKFESGYLSPYFITNTEKLTAELDDAYILIYKNRITNIKDIIGILEHMQKIKKPLVIITEDIEGDPLNTLVVNKMKGILNICIVKAPGYGETRTNILSDIATLTGGTVISEDQGVKLNNATINDLGRCDRIQVDKLSTILIGGKGESTEVENRIDELKSQLVTASGYYEMQLKDRIAKLSGGIAVIKVGAVTETEMKEKKDRVDDALAATKSAVDEGIIIGGGCAIIKSAEKSTHILEDLPHDQRIGAEIILRSIKYPIKQISENAGYDSGVVINEVLKSDEDIGFDASTGEYVDMFNTGIIDSLKVARVALSNATSVSSMLLTTEAVLSIKDTE